MQGDESENEEGGGTRGLQPEVIKSYLVFAARAVKKRWWVSGLIFAVGFGITIVAFRLLPRTFNCTTVMMGETNQVLEGWTGQNLFAAAPNLIMRHENLEAIVRDTDLVRKYVQRRPSFLAFKDQTIQRLFGAWDEETMKAILVGTLEYRVGVTTDGATMTISADWTDGKTAAEIAEAARDSYVKNRHSAEMSAFQEKMAILDGHAAKLRDEVESLATQIRTVNEDKLNEARAEARKAVPPSSSVPAPPVARAPRIAMPRPAAVEEDTDQPALKERLDAMKRKLSDLEGERDRRLREERGKLSELKLRLTPSHPEVVASEQRIALLAQEPSEIVLLRTETKSLENEIKQREALARRGSSSGSGGGSGPATASAEPLPNDIIKLLDEDDADPIMVAQLSGAISKYGALRSEIRSARIDLDTTQAAFNHRYKLVVPAAVPSEPVKPKAAVVLGGGFVAALLLALLIPILAELRSGIMVERWQVHQFQLPVLAELRLPPNSSD